MPIPIPVQPRALSDAQAAALLDVSLRRRDSTAFLRALQLAVKAHRYATVAQKTAFNRTPVVQGDFTLGQPWHSYDRYIIECARLPGSGLDQVHQSISPQSIAVVAGFDHLANGE